MRLKDLCDRLGADDQLRRRVWTTFEHCLVHEVKLMKDRHLDQFIMCAVYAICKVSYLQGCTSTMYAVLICTVISVTTSINKLTFQDRNKIFSKLCRCKSSLDWLM